MSTRRPSSSDDPPHPPPSQPSADDDDWNPDATPYIEGYDAPDRSSSGPLVGTGVPPVVAVVVTRDGGSNLAAALESLGRQEYANLSTLVVDAGSAEDPTPIVAAAMPSAFVRRTTASTFVEATNEAIGSVEGAAFFLLCHDDVEFRPGAVQALVEEAFRSNAGIVGAKLVESDRPDRLQSLGWFVDKFGFPWSIVDAGEMDQAQHDAVREVFVVSTAAMLVRCDLFADLGGLNPQMGGGGEALDLCWRARIAGARTVVMPAAVAAHRGDAALGDEVPSRRLALRHQARAVLTNYTPLHLLRVLPQSLLLAFIDFWFAVVRGRFEAAVDVSAAIGWNIAHLPAAIRDRGRVKRLRRADDDEIRAQQIRGSAWIRSVVQSLRSDGDRSISEAFAARARGLQGTGDYSGYWTVAAAFGIALVWLVGSRGLISGGVPVVREFTPIGSSIELLREWWTGWRSTGLGTSSAAPSSLGLLGGLAGVSLGSTGLVRTLLVLLPLLLGPLGAWRLLRAASPPARTAASVAYFVNPLPFNAIAEGRLQALVLYGLAPWVLARLCRVAGLIQGDDAVPVARGREVRGLALLVALGATFAPITAVVTLAFALLVAALAGGRGAGRGAVGRVLAVAGASVLVAALVHLPWTLSLLSGSNRWQLLVGASPSRLAPSSLREALVFATGPHGGWFSVGLLAVGVVPLLTANGRRFRWSLLAAALVVMSWVGVVAAARLAPSIPLPSTELLLVPAALGLALGAGAAVSAFERDVVGAGFGLGQIVSVLGGLGLVIASLPLTLDMVNGRWLAPRSDLDVAVSSLRGKALPKDRVLWLGDGDVLGAQGWSLGGGANFVLTDGPDTSPASWWPQAAGPAERRVASILAEAARGERVRLGHDLAAFSVRYVVVAERLAPLPYGNRVIALNSPLRTRLAEQIDLDIVDAAPGITVYENPLVRPIRATATQGGESRPALVDSARPTAFTGPVRDGETLSVATALDGTWSLEVDGRDVPLRRAGWSSTARIEDSGTATLARTTPIATTALHLVQLALLVALIWFQRRRSDAPVEPRRHRTVAS